jgi:hypothetical protein
MRFYIPCTACTAIGLVFALAAPAAEAQVVIAPAPVVTAPAPLAVVPTRTVTTVTTTRTLRPARRRRVTVRRAYVSHRYVSHPYISHRVVSTTTTVAAPIAAAAYPEPLYDYDYGSDYADYAAPAPVAPAPYYSEPLYDTVVTTPTLAPAIVPAAAAVPIGPGMAVPFYHYVYQDDRILVIDPNTGIAVQALPR